MLLNRGTHDINLPVYCICITCAHVLCTWCIPDPYWYVFCFLSSGSGADRSKRGAVPPQGLDGAGDERAGAFGGHVRPDQLAYHFRGRQNQERHAGEGGRWEGEREDMPGDGAFISP